MHLKGSQQPLHLFPLLQLRVEVQLREEEGSLPKEAREEVGMCPGDDLGGK